MVLILVPNQMFFGTYAVIVFHLLLAFKLDILDTRKIFSAGNSVLKLPLAFTNFDMRSLVEEFQHAFIYFTELY